MPVNKTINNIKTIKSISKIANKELAIIDLPSIDWHLSLKLALGKIKLAKDLHAIMINNLPKEQALINLAFNQQKLDDLREYIHKLHGGCCYTGFSKLKYIAKKLEQEIAVKHHNQINKNKIKQYIDLINQEINFLITQQFQIQNL